MKAERKVAVVTGAASGTGLALARALSERGCRLVLADADPGRVQAAAEEIGGEAFAVERDVRDRTAVEALADAAQARHGDVDIVFNNARVMPAIGPSAIEADPLDLDWVLPVNVAGTWNGCSVFGKRLAARPEPGWLVSTASAHVLGMQRAGQAFDTAAKHAILGMSDVIRAELPEQVGISVLCPGLGQSELWNAARHRAQPLDGDAQAFLPFAKAVVDHGMPPVEVAHKAIDGVERGDFLMVTHASSRPAAERRSSWSNPDVPDPPGRTAGVTGGNGSLGLETARVLAANGAHAVLAAWNQEKSAAAVEEIRASAPAATVEVVPLDLASQASAPEAGERVRDAHGHAGLLVNNAGVIAIPEGQTVDGAEKQARRRRPRPLVADRAAAVGAPAARGEDRHRDQYGAPRGSRRRSGEPAPRPALRTKRANFRFGWAPTRPCGGQVCPPPTKIGSRS